MPVRVESSATQGKLDASGSGASSHAAPGAITIGLVNNMPVGAFRATERQFVALLNAASEGIPVRLLLYTFPAASGAGPAAHAGQRYASVETLWESSAAPADSPGNGDAGAVQPHLDGLIVTGAEPLQTDLRDEAYWPSFTRLLDWARENTSSTVWSCLAAHAAVLHMDGIGRRRRATKLSGIYPCQPMAQHRLLAGAAPSFPVPHSRWNGLAEVDLQAHGYQVLARASDAEVDTFVKQQHSLFVFFQGHPEYESDTLLREYRRDAGRYLRQEAPTYPLVPHAYFDRDLEADLNALREMAMASRDPHAHGDPADAPAQTLEAVEICLEQAAIGNTWHRPAAHLYRNWLAYLWECRKAHAPESAAPGFARADSQLDAAGSAESATAG